MAVLLGTCALTGLVLYVGPLTAAVGRRDTVRDLHVWSGVLTPVPFVVAYAGRWRDAVRDDVRRLARWSWADKRWLRTRGRDETGSVGKFNAGQKLYAAWIAGAVLVMLGTGLLMWFTHLAPLVWRTGATFVHDWLAVAVVVVLAGHVWMALRDPEARRGMRTGLVDRHWAVREHPEWDPQEDRHSR